MSGQAYEKVVDFMINEIEKNQTLPWEQPWLNKDQSFPMNIRGNAYRGVNLFNLYFLQAIRGYSKNIWLTYRQASELKGNVKKGEKGVPVVFWNFIKKKSTSQQNDDEDEEKKIPFMKVYYVFNVDQCELPDSVLKKFAVEERQFVPIEEAERIVKDMPKKPEILHDQIARAFYRTIDDSVHVPEGKHFKKEEFYYSTLFHELVHSTGHKNRLGRDGVMLVESSSKQTYSEEELVAELGAVFLCGECQIEREPTPDHVAYLQNWVKFLKDHKKALIYAGQRAQKAVDFILNVKNPIAEAVED